MKIGNHETHELADAFPLMDDHRLRSLVDSIRMNGQRRPIVLHEGKVLDGRHRYLACLTAGIEPAFEEFGGCDPIQFVWDENGERRDLTDWQRAQAVTYLEGVEKQIKKRLRNKNQRELPAMDDKTEEKVAFINDNASPELRAALDAGEVHLSQAAALATADHDRQRQVLEDARKQEQQPGRRAHTESDTLTSLSRDYPPTECECMAEALRHLARQQSTKLRASVEFFKRSMPWL
jgi:ParB-like chromosome segregation protein Spo0J